ncbi:MAG TPA: hypothetical protein VLB82_04955 [Thermodesulfobacteriota bacterium]|jgi:hypothetical protein|nr:hypothetical protein [Thermodesulfobacteriota bacterium]
MAQHDMNIANQGFPAFRSDLNNALSAINSFQSGTSRPSGAVSGTIWLDTTSATTPTLKYYDGADDISLATLDHTANTVNWLDSTVVFDIVGDTTPQLGGDLDVNGNAFVSTSNGNITFTPNGTGKIVFNDLAYYPEVAITSTSNSVAWDSQAAPNAKHTTTENTTFAAPSNAQTGAFIALNIQYGGTHTIAWNTVFEFAASTAPTATSTSGKSDQFVFRYNGTVWQEVGRSLNMSAT